MELYTTAVPSILEAVLSSGGRSVTLENEGRSFNSNVVFFMMVPFYKTLLRLPSSGEEDVDECARVKLEMLASLDSLEISSVVPSSVVGKTYSVFFYAKEYLLWFDSQLDFSPEIVCRLPKDLLPPRKLFSCSKDCGKSIYLRVSRVSLVDGNFEENWRWYMRDFDPLTYVVKVSSRKPSVRLVERKVEKVESKEEGGSFCLLM